MIDISRPIIEAIVRKYNTDDNIIEKINTKYLSVLTIEELRAVYESEWFHKALFSIVVNPKWYAASIEPYGIVPTFNIEDLIESRYCKALTELTSCKIICKNLENLYEKKAAMNSAKPFYLESKEPEYFILDYYDKILNIKDFVNEDVLKNLKLLKINQELISQQFASTAHMQTCIDYCSILLEAKQLSSTQATRTAPIMKV